MEHLRAFVQYFKDKDPNGTYPRASEELFAHIEETLLPHLLRIMRKDNTLFADPEVVIQLFPEMDVKWDGTEEVWKRLHMALLHSVLHGDPKEKFGKIIETVKGMFPGGQSDKMMEILEDKETTDSMKEMLDLVMNTRLATIVGDLIQTIKIDDLEINFEDPEELAEIMKNPGSFPAIRNVMERAQEALKARIESGKINQHELIREIEMLRAKMTSTFGKYLNQMVIGEEGPKTGNTSKQILSNSPDARRARMLARLQKKQQEKSRK
jgi:hypothetical protein